jgi:hypothetical protein
VQPAKAVIAALELKRLQHASGPMH